MRFVLCLPSTAVNSLPGHLATEAGCVCTQAGAASTIPDTAGHVWLQGTRQNMLYRLECKMMHASAVHEGYVNVASDAVSTRVWHARLGHPGGQALMAVVAEAHLDGVMSSEVDRVCNGCMCTKQAREVSAKSAEGRA